MDLLGLQYCPWYPIPKTDESLSVPAPKPHCFYSTDCPTKMLYTTHCSFFLTWTTCHVTKALYVAGLHIPGFGEKTLRKKTIWRNWEMNKEYQKRILQKQDGRSSTEFVWLSTGIGGGLMWTRYWTTRSHKMLGIPRLTWQNSHRCV